MRSVLFAALGVLALSGCLGPDPCTLSTGPHIPLVAVISADNERDLERVLRFYTEDVVWIPPAPRPRLEGIGAIRASYETMYREFEPALTITFEQTTYHGDREAVVRGRTGGRLHPVGGGDDVVVDDVYRATVRCRGDAGWRIEELAWGASAP